MIQISLQFTKIHIWTEKENRFPGMWSRTKVWFLPDLEHLEEMEHLDENDDEMLRGLMRKLRSKQQGK